MFNIVLVSPEIPPNTGNIIRLCANTGCNLHLIKPLGFEMDDARLRRAGLDYREWVNIRIYDSYENLFRQYSHARRFIFSKWHTTIYSSVRFHSGDFLIFGSETSGLPVEIRESVDAEHQLILPMLPNSRSLNLSNAVAIIVYEAWRQNDFAFRD